MGLHIGIARGTLIPASRWLASQLEKELPAMIGKVDSVPLRPDA